MNRQKVTRSKKNKQRKPNIFFLNSSSSDYKISANIWISIFQLSKSVFESTDKSKLFTLNSSDYTSERRYDVRIWKWIWKSAGMTVTGIKKEHATYVQYRGLIGKCHQIVQIKKNLLQNGQIKNECNFLYMLETVHGFAVFIIILSIFFY